MTEHAPAHPRRRTRPTALNEDIPSTIWATGTEPIDDTDQWPTPIVTRAVTEFSHPGDPVLVLAPPNPTTGRRRTRLTASTKTAVTTIDTLGRAGAIEHLTSYRDVNRNTAPPSPDEGAALALATLLPPEGIAMRVIEDAITVAATRLRPGGVLAVFTRTTHTRDGALLDPTGPTVTAGQAADLLFLQHIVAVPVINDTIVTRVFDPTDTGRRHTIVHTDITVLLRP